MTNKSTPSGGLEGLAVLVTGGGTGIGHACAARLASDGAAVTICGRTLINLEESLEKIRAVADHGGSADLITADVTDEESVKAAMAKATEVTGNLNGVIANAGGGGGLGSHHAQELDEYRRILDLNVVGTMLCVKHSVALMAKAGGGSFIGMSSLAGHVTHRYFGAYCAAKAGIDHMMRNAADEYGGYGVRFNSIRPGFIATELMSFIPEDSSIHESYRLNTPLEGVGQPEDVANLARFLISDEARWVNGTAIAVDGGHALRMGPDFGEFIPDEGKNL
jgi:7-alpha-hydroxysteroid dehydrogenase